MNNILKMISKMESNANEVKLGKHEVELSLFDDIKSSIEGARKLKTEIESNFSKANGGLRFCDNFDKSFNKALVLAKEVGLQIPNDVTKLKDMSDELRSFFNKINSINK